MEDTVDAIQPTEPTPVITPVIDSGAHESAVTESTPAEPSVTEESFLRKNKMLIIGGIVALIVITVAVGILLSLKNSQKLEGLIKLREQTQNTQTQEQSVKIPRK